MEHAWEFTVIMILAAAIGVLLFFYPATWWHPEFVRALAEALVIAGLLGLTVERYVRERVLREMARDVSHYLIGYEQPAEIRDQIRDLMQVAIVRKDFHQVYKITASEGQLELGVEFSFYVENFSSTMKDYEPYLAFEKHENPTVTEFRCDSADKKAVFCKQGEQAKLEESEEAGVLKITGKKIKLQPRDKAISYQISGKYSRRVKEEDSDILSFGAPTIGVTVKVDTVPADLEFVAPSATVETQRRWEYRRLFLVGQHIHVRWFSRSKEPEHGNRSS